MDKYGSREKPLLFGSGETAMAWCKSVGAKIWVLINGHTYEMYPGGRVIDWTEVLKQRARRKK